MYSRSTLTFDLCEFENLPCGAQSILVYCLEKNDPNVGTLSSDSDAGVLCEIGWLMPQSRSAPGMSNFEIHPLVWKELKMMQLAILTAQRIDAVNEVRSWGANDYPRFW